MQPNILQVDDTNHRVFTNSNSVNYPALGIEEFALRRVFAIEQGQAKYVDFVDLPEFWKIESIYISSPEESELLVEIVNDAGIPFFSDRLMRNETPKQLPTVLVDNSVKLKLTAYKSPINLLLLYLKPAHLAYMKDF